MRRPSIGTSTTRPGCGACSTAATGWNAGCGQRSRSSRRKGIILAGGSGTRLYPITQGVSKQLLPVYDKPMIYYPLSVLMLAGIREVLIITTPHEQALFQRCWATARSGAWASSTRCSRARRPGSGVPDRSRILAGAPVCLVLGDNIFYGQGFPSLLKRADERERRRHGVRLPGEGSRALRRRRVRRRRPRRRPRGEAGAAEVATTR